MKRIVETFHLPSSPDTFWRLFFDQAYVRALYLDGLGFKGFEVLEQANDSRKLRIVPKLNVPDVLAKLIGDAFAYEEHGVLDRARGEWTWRMVQPPGSLDLVSTHGTVRIEPAGDGACRRHDDITIVGRFFGLGRLIESAAENEARAAWKKEVPFFSRWVADHPSG